MIQCKQKCEVGRGDLNLEDRVHLKCHNDMNLELEEDLESALRAFKEGDDGSAYWEDRDNSEFLSSKEEQEQVSRCMQCAHDDRSALEEHW